MKRHEFHAMGCRMLAVLDTDSPHAMYRLAQVPHWFDNWEQHLSRFREASELSELNRASSAPRQVSAVLWDVVQAALEAARESEGLVVPTLLGALEAAGYDRTFEAISPAPSLTRSFRPVNGDDRRAIECDACTRSIRLSPGVRLDLGGIAKGFAADRAARRLGKLGPALVDAGSDIAITRLQSDGQRWPIGVTNPLQPDQQLELLMIAQGGVATSGRDYRRWQRDGAWQHHIIDPRTGQPAVTDVLSVTVIAPSAREAEVAAKAALILGSDDGLEWIEARPALAGLLVLEDGRVIYSHRLRMYLWS